MADNSLINLGELSKPATVLIEKVSDAIGGLAKPWQTKRVARAETEAAKIRALAEIELSDLERRAVNRLINEESKRQENIENITAKAIPHLEDNANPNEVDDDWITHFFEKSKIVSDQEMQTIWSRILAGESNKKNSFSRRTIDIVSTLSKREATHSRLYAPCRGKFLTPKSFIITANFQNWTGCQLNLINSCILTALV